ncbi:TetR/AcrR family transcriptional regulator [Gracilibacillus alcaliphilus]|uniref:TetR/AcrR family transcriptional regulator n=1 Tax=Gracilibacillus alcaliphilus TaxID=1401441 RepID=UPI00195620F4|nr:TetR/AcrR family transcriptional regulator [Gracilibacillus alcaliphilus]MBM7675760.1 AcrR family transcriptional regulator [Gracilibacillus alcaliphilus]
MRKNKVETEQTIRNLINIARHHFTEYGYVNTALEEIVKEAGLTRGAVYHHFRNKKGLFLAVFEAIQQEIGEYVETAAAKSNHSWDQLINGCQAFLEGAAASHNQRILLIDGPAVLGWDTFRKMDEKYSMNSLREQLQLMQEQHLIQPVSTEALTHCLSGAMNEVVLWIADHLEQKDAIEDAMNVLRLLLDGVRK